MIKSFIYKSKKNDYQKFLIKLLVLFIILVFFDLSIDSLLNIYYFKQDSGMQYRTTYSIEKTTADLLIFGSSTANHNYYPGIFQNRLNLDYYNVGRDGQSIFYHYAVLEAVLKRYTPKMIIYDFDEHEFSKDQESYDRISSLLPYYKKHPEIRSIVELKSPYEKFKLLSNIYPLNSSIFTIAVGNTEFNKKRWPDNKGYVPLTNVWNEPMSDGNTFVNYEIDSNKIKLYESFIKDCINSKIELYIFCSPLFMQPNYVSYSVASGKKIAGKYNVRFFDYSKDSIILNNPKLFADVGHLNDKGAKVYSNKVIDTISRVSKSLIKKPGSKEAQTIMNKEFTPGDYTSWQGSLKRSAWYLHFR